jgi:hypothetical protein
MVWTFDLKQVGYIKRIVKSEVKPGSKIRGTKLDEGGLLEALFCIVYIGIS